MLATFGVLVKLWTYCHITDPELFIIIICFSFVVRTTRVELKMSPVFILAPVKLPENSKLNVVVLTS